ncbi:MAG: hypothetical protein ACE5JC_03350 [Candidatus Zixiibacteriota bacterium]
MPILSPFISIIRKSIEFGNTSLAKNQLKHFVVLEEAFPGGWKSPEVAPRGLCTIHQLLKTGRGEKGLDNRSYSHIFCRLVVWW